MNTQDKIKRLNVELHKSAPDCNVRYRPSRLLPHELVGGTGEILVARDDIVGMVCHVIGGKRDYSGKMV